MKLLRILRLSLASVFLFSTAGFAAEEPDPGQIEFSVGKMLETGHYTKKRLDDNFSRLLLKNYLEELDYNHLFFTQKDVDTFNQKYGATLDDDILLGNPEAAYKVFDIYKKRVEDRVAKVKELLKQSYTFASDRSIEINRQKAPWPKDDAAADALWRDRIEGEMLQEDLAKHKAETAKKDDAVKKSDDAAKKSDLAKQADGEIKGDKVTADAKVEPADTPEKIIGRRYDQLLRSIHEQNKEDQMKLFLNNLAQSYDPHSEYMSRSELENFSINMRLSLVGIGAVLRSDEGYARIMELVPGGPAARDGRLKVGDRVRAVAQGDKDFVDTMDMKLDKVVEMIRGKKDSIVRLQVVPRSATDPSVRKVIDIKREEITIKESEAKAEIVERPQPDGTVQRLGWITLPSFYADMEHSGAANAKSTTKDVLALLNRLKQEGITGLVMDLRRNGGGSLEEAVNLTGLFVKKGPVVQAKDSNGSMHVSKCRDTSVAYDGPLIVLTNRLSASASEIFAAALQDYNRALIVGDQNTFGKGTVQTMIELGHYMAVASNNEAGALKLTIQKFYRIAGGSTQLRGVESDIKLPSLFDQPEFGESSLKGPLPYDTVDRVPFDKWDKPLFKNELAKRSSARIASDQEFTYIQEDLSRIKQRVADNKISLNEKVRLTELDEDKARKDKRTAERAKVTTPESKTYLITLENLSKPELQLAKSDAKANEDQAKAEVSDDASDADPDDLDNADGSPKKPLIDPVRNETLNILGDYIDLAKSPAKTASANSAAAK